MFTAKKFNTSKSLSKKFDKVIYIVKLSSGMPETFSDTLMNWSRVTWWGCRTTLSILFTVYLAFSSVSLIFIARRRGPTGPPAVRDRVKDFKLSLVYLLALRNAIAMAENSLRLWANRKILVQPLATVLRTFLRPNRWWYEIPKVQSIHCASSYW